MGFTQLECVKYLDIVKDQDLNWKSPINLVVTVVSKAVGMLARLRRLLPLRTLTQMYQSLIYPYLTIGLSSWGQANKADLDKLLLLQKRGLGIRLIHQSTDSREHAIPLFIQRNIIPITFLCVQIISKLMYNVRNNLAPINIQNLFIIPTLFFQ